MALRGAAPLATQRHTLRGTRASAVDNGTMQRCSAAQKGIHPTFYPEAKIFCNGAEVMTTGGTKKEYIVDIWSGNHPFYQGQTKTVVMDDGRVSRFNKMYPDLADSLGAVETMASIAADKAAASGAPAAAAAPTKPTKAAPKQAAGKQAAPKKK